MWTYNYIQNKLKRRREDERGLRIDLLSIRKSFRRCIHSVSGIMKALSNKMESLEYDLNILGYTMQDEHKERQYHVNILKGEDDE